MREKKKWNAENKISGQKIFENIIWKCWKVVILQLLKTCKAKSMQNAKTKL